MSTSEELIDRPYRLTTHGQKALLSGICGVVLWQGPEKAAVLLVMYNPTGEHGRTVSRRQGNFTVIDVGMRTCMVLAGDVPPNLTPYDTVTPLGFEALAQGLHTPESVGLEATVLSQARIIGQQKRAIENKRQGWPKEKEALEAKIEELKAFLAQAVSEREHYKQMGTADPAINLKLKVEVQDLKAELTASQRALRGANNKLSRLAIALKDV